MDATLRRAVLGAAIALLSFALWRAELFTVQRPGSLPADLRLIGASRRAPCALDVPLPAVPSGATRLRSGEGALLLHYWAPWQRDAAAQAAALDSLRRTAPPGPLRIAIVCFDPFPSVARYVARRRLTLPVLLDTRGRLRERLPCPSIPYTYVLDAQGRVAVDQPGEVDWLSSGTRATLRILLEERIEAAPSPATRTSPATRRDTPRRGTRSPGSAPDSSPALRTSS